MRKIFYEMLRITLENATKCLKDFKDIEGGLEDGWVEEKPLHFHFGLGWRLCNFLKILYTGD